jgi:hypothetical protein
MMKYRTTIGSSLISSGIVTLLLKILPGNSLWYGVLFLIAGSVVFILRKSDVSVQG